MLDFSAADLLVLAQARFGAATLEQRVAPGGSSEEKDLELLKKAYSVVTRAQAALQGSVGWPLPGTWPAGSKDPRDGTTDISGHPYSAIWPADLLEHAIGLLNWRTYDGTEQVSIDVRKIGEAHESYFQRLEQGAVGLGIGGKTDTGIPLIAAARDRTGANLLSDQAPDRTFAADTMTGIGWDIA